MGVSELKKVEAIMRVQAMIEDKNYYLNSNINDEKRNYAWKYSMLDLKNVLMIIEAIDDLGDW